MKHRCCDITMLFVACILRAATESFPKKQIVGKDDRARQSTQQRASLLLWYTPRAKITRKLGGFVTPPHTLSKLLVII